MKQSDINISDQVHLLGRPPIQEFLQFAKTRAYRPRCSDEAALAGEWITAGDYIRELETTEAGYADTPRITRFSTDSTRAADQEIDRATKHRSLGVIPHYWANVEIDRCVVWQKVVDLHYVKHVEDSLGKSPTEDDLVRVATGCLPAPGAVNVVRLSESLYSISSVSADMRILETVELDPTQVPGYAIDGRPVALIGAFVGFGSNFVSALETHSRLILMNGTHRAYALRELGFRHIPCLIRRIDRLDEFDLVGASEIKQSADLYLRGRRPPVFKDYFDRRLRTIIPCIRTTRVVHVQINTNYTHVAVD